MARIMIIDDDRVLREEIASMIANGGHQVCEASGAMQALRMMETVLPDVIVCDICMPFVTGVEFKNYINNFKKLNNTKFIFVSALSEPELSEAATNAGVGAFLQKPVRSDDVIKAVNLQLADQIYPMRHSVFSTRRIG